MTSETADATGKNKEEPLSLVAGARLSPGGLHLGHLVGNFLPVLDFTVPTEYFFVLKDTEPLIRHDPDERQQLLLDTIADSLAVPFADQIVVAFASTVLSHCYHLYSHVIDIVSFNSLVTAHFRKQEFREQKSHASVKNFLFPVDEAVVLLALRARYFLSNDDNIRLVRFTRDVVRKFNKTSTGPALDLPELRHHSRVARLLGPGYGRMCKANNNTISLAEPTAGLREKVRKLVSWKQYFNYDPSALDLFREAPSRFVFPENYLPFVYLDLFGQEQVSEDERRYFSDSSKRDELEELVFRVLDRVIEPMRRRKLKLLEQKPQIYKRLEADSEKTILRVRETDARVARLIKLAE